MFRILVFLMDNTLRARIFFEDNILPDYAHIKLQISRLGHHRFLGIVFLKDFLHKYSQGDGEWKETMLSK